MDMRHQIIQQAVTGILAVILLGGTMSLLLLGRTVPEFLVGFDGVIVTAAFANGAFFVQARAQMPLSAALATSMQQHHDLAIVGMEKTAPSPTGLTNPAGSVVAP